jgi:hypothetical protein
METKHLLSLIVLTTVGPLLVLLTTFSQRLRDLAFFAMIIFGVILIDVNFLGEYWYRGTSRGLEISLVDLLGWAVLISSILQPRYPGPRWIWPVGCGFMVLYFLYCCYSVANAQVQMFGLWELGKVFRGLLIILAAAAYVRTRRELGILVFALGCTVCIETVYAVKQRFMSGMYRVPGTLDHENSLSMYMCVVGPFMLAAALSEWSKMLRIFAAICAVLGGLCVLLTLSRAGMPIYVMMCVGVTLSCTSLEITRKKVMIACTVIGLFGAALVKSWDQIAMRYASASFADEYLDETKEGRGVYWRWAFLIVKEHPQGVGLNNWSYAVSKTYGADLGFVYEDYDNIRASPEKADLPSINYAAPAHSLAALTLGELGYPGLVLFGLVWLRWFSVGATFLWRRLNPDPEHRLGIGCLFGAGGIFLQSVTEWTYRQQVNMFVFHILMGVMASLHYAKKHRPKPAEIDEFAEEEIEIEVAPARVPARAAR